MLTTDVDLLRLDPSLFRDVVWLGQRLTRGTVSIVGTTLTAVGADVPFDAAGVAPGHVCTVDGASYEVVERTGPTTLTLSRVRPPGESGALPPAPVTNRLMHVVTFAPQRAIAHRQVMRLFGIDPEWAAPGEPTLASVLNPGSLVRLEAMAALHAIYAAAGASAGAGTDLAARADRWLTLFRRDRDNAGAVLDLDGDGLPDAIRRAGVVPLMRS